MNRKIRINAFLLLIIALVAAQINAQPNNAALFDRASESVKAGKYDDAIRDLTAIINTDQNNYKAYLLRGICFWAKKELEVAALKKDPAKAYRLEVEIYSKLKPGEVQPKSQSSLSAIADLTKAIQLQPTAYSPYNVRGKVYLLEQDLEPAISDFQKVTELKPDYQQEPTLKTLKDTLTKTRNDYAGKLRMRSLELAISIGYSKEYQTKASGEELAKSQKQTAENEKLRKSLLLKAVQTYSPIDFYTFSSRGDCYKDLENWNAAIADYTEALKLKPAEISTHIELAKAYAKAGQTQKALSEYERIITMPVPKDKKFYQDSAYVERANIYSEQGKLNEAIVELDKAIAANPDYFIAYFNRGKLHAEKGNKQLARADFVKASKAPDLLSASQKQIDILDGKVKPEPKNAPRNASTTVSAKNTKPATAKPVAQSQTATPKNASAAQPADNSFTFVRIPAPEPYESQFQQAIKDAPNKTNPSLHRQTAFANFYNAVANSSLPENDRKKYIANKLLEIADTDMYAAYQAFMGKNVQDTYMMAIIEAMPREMAKEFRETANLVVEAYLGKAPKLILSDVFRPGYGWGKTVSSDTEAPRAGNASGATADQLSKERTKLAALTHAQGLVMLDSDKKAALASFRKALEIDPNYQPAKDSIAQIAADEFIAKGDEFSAAKDYSSALTEYNAAVQAAPNYINTYWKRSLVLNRMHFQDPSKENLLQDSVSDLNKVVQMNPSFPDAYFIRGNVLTVQRKWEPAIADLTKAISLNPKRAEFYDARANLYRIVGDDARKLADIKMSNQLKGIK